MSRAKFEWNSERTHHQRFEENGKDYKYLQKIKWDSIRILRRVRIEQVRVGEYSTRLCNNHNLHRDVLEEKEKPK